MRRAKPPARLAARTTDPQANHIDERSSVSAVQERQNYGEGVLGEKLLPAENHDQESERVAHFGDEDPPRGIGEVGVQQRLGQKGEAHGEARGEAGPGKGGGGRRSSASPSARIASWTTTAPTATRSSIFRSSSGET